MIPLRWGMCGARNKSTDLIYSMGFLPHGSNIAKSVADYSIPNANAFGQLHKITSHGDDFKKIATDEEINIVYVCLSYEKQFNIIKMMLEHDKHVLCEPPMGINHFETNEIVSLARTKKKFLMEAVWSRFFPVYDELNLLLSQGAIGDVQQITANLGIKLNESPFSTDPIHRGSLMNLSTYVLQLARFVFGDIQPGEVAVAGYINNERVDENSTIMIKYPGERIGVFSVHTKTSLSNVAEISGSNGFILIPNFTNPTVIQDSKVVKQYALPSVSKPFHYSNGSGLVYELMEVNNCIIEGLIESTKMSHRDSCAIAETRDIVIYTQRFRQHEEEEPQQ